MAALGRYIFSVTTAAILYSILQSLLGQKHGTAALLRLIGGLFLAFTVISPVSNIKLDSFIEIPQIYSAQGNAIAAKGQVFAQEQLREIIKEQSEAYILNKAMSYQTELDVEITLSQDETPVISAVRLKGAISPYAKNLMEKWIYEELGVQEENQIWVG